MSSQEAIEAAGKLSVDYSGNVDSDYANFLEKSKFKKLLKTGVSVPKQSSGHLGTKERN